MPMNEAPGLGGGIAVAGPMAKVEQASPAEKAEGIGSSSKGAIVTQRTPLYGRLRGPRGRTLIAMLAATIVLSAVAYLMQRCYISMKSNAFTNRLSRRLAVGGYESDSSCGPSVRHYAKCSAKAPATNQGKVGIVAMGPISCGDHTDKIL